VTKNGQEPVLFSPLLGSTIRLSIDGKRSNPMTRKSILTILKSILLAGCCAALLTACVPWTVNPDEPSYANPSGKGPSAD
jgi:hypothetical protein